MKTIPLKYPFDFGDKKITEVAVRRPKAKDMIAIGDYMPALANIDPDEKNGAAAMNGETFRAMVAIVGALTGIGEECAGELDFADLMTVATEAMSSMGEADGSSGEAKTGA